MDSDENIVYWVENHRFYKIPKELDIYFERSRNIDDVYFLEKPID